MITNHQSRTAEGATEASVVEPDTVFQEDARQARDLFLANGAGTPMVSSQEAVDAQQAAEVLTVGLGAHGRLAPVAKLWRNYAFDG